VRGEVVDARARVRIVIRLAGICAVPSRLRAKSCVIA
jgi:hypothetical protein